AFYKSSVDGKHYAIKGTLVLAFKPLYDLKVRAEVTVPDSREV
ncbi:hypothetical protein A2U01_0083982, partial [Trifolium medium]|nr:hypothetical protein [Trifolium medium]